MDSGEGRYEIEGQVFPVQEGDVVVINNVERHRVTYVPDRPLVETVLHFSPTLLGQGSDGYRDLFRASPGVADHRPPLDPPARAAVGDLFRSITAEYLERRPHREALIRALLLTLVAHLLRAGTDGAGPSVRPAEPACRKELQRLEGVLGHIRQHFAGPLALPALARRCGVSPSYFSDLFRRTMGISLTEYIARLRVHAALRLLHEGRLTSTEIAFEVGFRNLASFYNAFRRVAGGSPRQIREQGTAEEKPKKVEEIHEPDRL